MARGGELAEELIRDADAAMYRAKEHGRARYELFDEVMRGRAIARLRVENDLRRALERDELRLDYQPRRLAAAAIDRSGRGAAALGSPGARRRLARRLHPGRRGERADRADRPLGARAGLPPGGSVAARSGRDAAPLCVSVNLSTIQVAKRGCRRRRRRGARRHAPAAPLPQPRDHRERDGEGRGDARRLAARAQGARAADRARRLRHRVTRRSAT